MKHTASQTSTTIAILALLTAILMQTTHADIGNLTITNRAGTSFTLTSSQLQAMPKTTVNADLYCDGSLVATGNWSGIQLSYLLSQTQVTPEIQSLQFDASDGYRIFIPIALATDPQIIIAYELNGKPLTEGLRLVLPGLNGAAWIAMVTIITTSTETADYPLGLSVGVPTTSLAPTPDRTQFTPAPQPTSHLQNATPTATNSSTPSSTESNETTEHQTKPNDGGTSQDLISLSVALTAVILGALSCMIYKRKRKRGFTRAHINIPMVLFQSDSVLSGATRTRLRLIAHHATEWNVSA